MRVGIKARASCLTPVTRAFPCLQPGDVIFREGEEGNRFYVVVEGSVQIYKASPALWLLRLTVTQKRSLPRPV